MGVHFIEYKCKILNSKVWQRHLRWVTNTILAFVKCNKGWFFSQITTGFMPLMCCTQCGTSPLSLCPVCPPWWQRMEYTQVSVYSHMQQEEAGRSKWTKYMTLPAELLLSPYAWVGMHVLCSARCSGIAHTNKMDRAREPARGNLLL